MNHRLGEEPDGLPYRPTGMTTSRVRWFLPALVFAMLGACGDDGPSSPASGLAALRGRTYVTREITIDGTTAATPQGVRIEITFGADATLGARAGCNSIGGTYHFAGDVLVAGRLTQTEMACAPELMALDTTVVALLSAAPRVTFADGTVTVTSPNAMLALTDIDAADPASPFVGTVWILDTIVQGETASSLPRGLPKPIALTFTDTGDYVVDTGCNGVGGTYTKNGTTVRVKPGPSTLMACANPLGSLETSIGSFFATGTITAKTDRHRLMLTAADGSGFGFAAAR